VLLGLSLFSFVSVDPVHPLTGLATLGGCLGAALAFPSAAVRIAGRGHAEHEGIVGASVGALRDEPSLSLIVIAYGSMTAYVYPTLFRIGGTLLGSSQWVFGTISQVPAALLSAVLFAVLLGALSYGFLRVFSDELRQTPPVANETALLAVSHAVYAVAVFVATGLSSSLWYQLIPSV
jgi:hypothetical protein